MMDQYELYKLAQYTLTSIEKNAIRSCQKTDFLSFFEREGARILNVDYDSLGFTSLRKLSRKDDFDEDEIFEQRSKIIIKELKKKYSKEPKQISDIQRTLNFIQEALDLSEMETEILGLYVRGNVFDAVDDFFRHYDDFSHFRLLAENFLRVSSDDVRIAKKKFGNYCLIDDGFSRRDFELTDFIKNIFEQHPQNKEEFERYFLGTPLKGTLKWSDFSHIPCIDSIAKIISNAIKTKQKGINILLYGYPGTGKTEFVKTLASKIKTNMYAIGEDSEERDHRYRGSSLRYGKILFSQQIMRNSTNTCFLFDEAEDLFYHENLSKIQTNRLLENNQIPIIWTTNKIMADSAFARRFTYSYQFEEPEEEIRTKMWQKALKENGLTATKKTAEKYSKRFVVPPAFIANAAKTAKLAEGGLEMVEETLESMQKLCGIKDKKEETKPAAVAPFRTDLLNTSIDLKQLANRIKDLNLKRFSLCLYGAPGTGKSAYGIWLAEQLKMPVLQKKCSDLKDKFVGETEKNIAKAFAEAKKKGAILIFDEADSFLHNRETSQRSWESSEVNEMLTQMENATHPFICTTNLMNTLDKAALRRFTFKVSYKFMTNEQKTLAFEHFFKIKNVDLSDLQDLSPADFELTYRKAEILGVLDNKNELIELLRAEQKENPEYKFKMGFHN